MSRKGKETRRMENMGELFLAAMGAPVMARQERLDLDRYRMEREVLMTFLPNKGQTDVPLLPVLELLTRVLDYERRNGMSPGFGSILENARAGLFPPTSALGRVAILPDVLGYEQGLQAVFQHALQRGCETILCLGDLAGVLDHGETEKICTFIREADLHAVGGVRDQAVIGQLSSPNQIFLETLPSLLAMGEMVFAPISPVREQVVPILNVRQAARALAELPARLIFVGHVYRPLIFREVKGEVGLMPCDVGVSLPLEPHVRYVIGCGSVGQGVRPHPCYTLWDSVNQTLEFCEVPVTGARPDYPERRAMIDAMDLDLRRYDDMEE
ncbi:MAG: hypothetical protein HQL56_17590 [Magnetococcales bacterium]|nr:hypothetical protein [Magnetococcales bacterium]